MLQPRRGTCTEVGTNSADSQPLTAKTIFQELQSKGISWRIYVNPAHSPCTGTALRPRVPDEAQLHPVFRLGTNYSSELAVQDCPDFAVFHRPEKWDAAASRFDEPASNAGLDEHPSDSDKFPINVQLGARYVSTLINALMASSSWSDSAFILTFDESGGLYDHVAPLATVSPDGIKPKI